MFLFLRALIVILKNEEKVIAYPCFVVEKDVLIYKAYDAYHDQNFKIMDYKKKKQKNNSFH